VAADEALDVKYVYGTVDDKDDGGLLSLLVVADAVAILEGGNVEEDNGTANAEEDADTDGANVNEAPNASAAVKEEGVTGVAAAAVVVASSSSLPVNDTDIIIVVETAAIARSDRIRPSRRR
jgi:hypothetical protein